jgi:uncharacterized integral membrane protein
MVVFRIVLLLVVFVLLLVLALMNAQDIATARVFGATFEDVPVAFIMLYSFAFGALCVGVFTLVSEIRLRTRLRRQQRELDSLLEELRDLRNAPLEPGNNPEEAEL